MSDLRLALRSLWRSPGFSAIVVLTLALGIGANTAIFSLFDAVMLRRLAVERPEELWRIYDDGPSPDGARAGTTTADIYSWPLVQQFERALPEAAALAAMTPPTTFNARVDAEAAPGTLLSQLVSGSYFSTFGARAALGRLIAPADNTPDGEHAVVVLGYTFWQRQFGADPSVLGRTIVINRVPFTVIGVAGQGFRGNWSDTTIEAWLPLVMQQTLGYRQNAATHNAEDEKPWALQDRVFWLNAVIRAPAAQHTAIAARLGPLYETGMREVLDQGDAETRSLRQRTLHVDSFARGYSTIREQYSQMLTLLMSMVTLLLLVACANVGNLLLARWTARQREVAIRLSIGDGRWRIVRQLLVEAAVLALAGGVLALVLANAVSGTIATSASVRSLLPARIALDGRVLAFCALVSLTTTLAFGIFPALRATAASPLAAVRTTGTAPRRTAFAMRPLVAAQVGLSVVLVVAAVLFARSLVNLWNVDPGYDRTSLVRVRMDPLGGGVPIEEVPDLYRRIAERARQIPGVVDAEVAYLGLASGARSIGSIELEGYVPAPGEQVRFWTNQVGPTYFTTTGMALVAGRAFTERDVEGQPQVAVINETAARYFGGAPRALGKRIGYGELDKEIVGVVRDAHTLSLREAPAPMAFYPILQWVRPAQALELRITGDAAVVGEAVRKAVAALEPRLLANSRPTRIADALDRGLTRDRLIASLAAGFGATSLLLACIGLFGVLAYSVERRRTEMGVRMAVGARPADITRLVLGEGVRVAGIGILLGIAAALASTRLVAALLFGVTPADPATYAAVIGALLATAALASYLPARRASRVDPMTALRSE